MAYSPAAIKTMLDALSIGFLSLHDDDPGIDGSNEISGSGYTRQACVFEAEDGGMRSLSEAVQFSGPPAQAVTHIGVWDDNVFLAGLEISEGDTTFNAAGEFIVADATRLQASS